MMARVLLVTYIRELIGEQETILRNAGYDVVVTSSFAESSQAIENQVFDLSMMGFSIPVAERNQLAQAFKQANPAAKIIMIYFKSLQNTELADAILQTTATPQEILTAVNYLLRKENDERPRAC
ncbi:MAG TPA: hypothetical protein VFB79_15265 [Candidatus Angelobacter sp.]|nr:hypothetical protein [Candidatus Angelobacter sp.]